MKSRGYANVNRFLGLVLVVFAFYFFRDGLRILEIVRIKGKWRILGVGNISLTLHRAFAATKKLAFSRKNESLWLLCEPSIPERTVRGQDREG